MILLKIFEKDFPEVITNLEEALLKYIVAKDLYFLKTEFPDNRWKYLAEKLAYPYEYFNSLVDYQKPC